MTETGNVKKVVSSVPWGMIAGISAIVCFFLTGGLIISYAVNAAINAETQATTTLFDFWWQTLMFVIDIIAAVVMLSSIAFYTVKAVIGGGKKQRIIEKKGLWILLSVFFALLLVVSGVAKIFASQYEGALNYALNITTSVKVQSADSMYSDMEYYKSKYYKDNGIQYDSSKMREASYALGEQIASEGAVLLWNNDSALPLSPEDDHNISFFGISTGHTPGLEPTGAKDKREDNYLYNGHGSGRVYCDVTEFDGINETFEKGGFAVNTALRDFYNSNYGHAKKNYYNTEDTQHPDDRWIDRRFNEFSVYEQSWDAVTEAAGSSLSAYGDAAIYVISRTGAEDGDTWYDTSINHSDEGFLDNCYLDLTANEVSVIEGLGEMKANGTVDKIILLINSGTPLHMKHISEYSEIDACMWVGMGGSSSFGAIYNVITGEENPSGRLPDTFVYNGFSAPATENLGRFIFDETDEFYDMLPEEGRGKLTGHSNDYHHEYMIYQEGIYVGYRYYETRYEDCILGEGSASANKGVVGKEEADSWEYNNIVAYPFGYGMSYTTFTQEVTDFRTVNGEKTVYEIDVKVTNTGKTDGKEVVQIYLQKPYTAKDKQFGIEKASVELVGFAKTDVIKAGQSKTLTVTVDEYEFKTYDAYDKKTYILETGDYYLSVGNNAHDALNNILAAKGKSGMIDFDGSPTSGDASKVRVLHLEESTKYSVSPTGYAVTNRFNDADINLYEGTAGQKIKYLSRQDWNGTYPDGTTKVHVSTQKFANDMQFGDQYINEESAPMPEIGKVTNENGALTLAMLMDPDTHKISYDDPLWDDLLNQITWDEMVKLCGDGFHIINSVPSISSPSAIAHDGPAGVKSRYPSTAVTSGEARKNRQDASVSSYFAFPTGVLLAATFNVDLALAYGDQFAEEMLHAEVTEIYGTGANMHRTIYGGRNWEYFSEDGFLSGRILGYQTKGIVDKGAIVNIKHFVLNDQEVYRCGITTWSNEQALREIYLKAFEEGITYGKANGIMTALNRIGPTWSSRHKGLLTEVLRNEWGFKGLVETDAASGKYTNCGASRADSVIAGTDLWLRSSLSESELWGDYRDNPKVVNALRQSCKNIIYTVGNSYAMNDIDSSTRIIALTPWYKYALNGVQAFIVTLLSAAVFLTVIAFVYDKVYGVKADGKGSNSETEAENE